MSPVRALVIACAFAGCRVSAPGLPVTEDAAVKPPPAPDGRPPAPRDAPWAPDAPRERYEPDGLAGPPAQVGCADGTREGFPDLEDWPKIAGCSGAWLVPGLLGPEARQ